MVELDISSGMAREVGHKVADLAKNGLVRKGMTLEDRSSVLDTLPRAERNYTGLRTSVG
jgi:hypothetical protein